MITEEVGFGLLTAKQPSGSFSPVHIREAAAEVAKSDLLAGRVLELTLF